MKPWLWLPPQLAHDISGYALRFLGALTNGTPPAWRSFVWRGLVFKNRLGLAGGADKNGESLHAWWAFGCGFVEVGTVTPRPQDPNPGRIMDRDASRTALWNRMGFPSEGAEEVLANLRAAKPYLAPVFVNIGKNRDTPNENATDDYLALIRAFAGTADGFVVNVSSPNTKGLRDLQGGATLRAFLRPLVEAARAANCPILVKLSPDMGAENLADAVTAAADAGIDGYVLTNTTLWRPDGCQFPPEGGLSGEPLKELSRRALKTALDALGPRREGKLIVSVGGVMTPEEVFERLDMGADLVEVYSALIFEGPWFFRKAAKHA